MDRVPLAISETKSKILFRRFRVFLIGSLLKLNTLKVKTI